MKQEHERRVKRVSKRDNSEESSCKQMTLWTDNGDQNAEPEPKPKKLSLTQGDIVYTSG